MCPDLTLPAFVHWWLDYKGSFNQVIYSDVIPSSKKNAKTFLHLSREDDTSIKDDPIFTIIPILGDIEIPIKQSFTVVPSWTNNIINFCHCRVPAFWAKKLGLRQNSRHTLPVGGEY